MAGRARKVTSRLAARREHEAAEAVTADQAAAPAPAPKRTVRRKATKKVDPNRLRLVWGVFDNSNQQVATFAYPERAAADQKAVELSVKGRGPYFVQPVKEPMPIDTAEKPG